MLRSFLHHLCGSAGIRECVCTVDVSVGIRCACDILCHICNQPVKIALCCSIHPLIEQILWNLHNHHLSPGFLWQVWFRTSTSGICLRCWLSYLLYFGSFYISGVRTIFFSLHSGNILANICLYACIDTKLGITALSII